MTQKVWDVTLEAGLINESSQTNCYWDLNTFGQAGFSLRLTNEERGYVVSSEVSWRCSFPALSARSFTQHLVFLFSPFNRHLLPLWVTMLLPCAPSKEQQNWKTSTLCLLWKQSELIWKFRAWKTVKNVQSSPSVTCKLTLKHNRMSGNRYITERWLKCCSASRHLDNLASIFSLCWSHFQRLAKR